MRSCYDDIRNNVKESIAGNSCNRAEQLSLEFSKENMYKEFVNAVYDFESLKEREEEVENLLNDLL